MTATVQKETTHYLGSLDTFASGVKLGTETKNAICIGSGRFLRSVLVPALLGGGGTTITDSNNSNGLFKVAIFQTRGRSLLDYCKTRWCENKNDNKLSSSINYEVDTVQRDGTIDTEEVGPIEVVGTLGTKEGKEALWTLIQNCYGNISVLGVGVTEAGLASHTTPVMNDIVDILHCIYKAQKQQTSDKVEGATENASSVSQKVCIINTDNVPSNGDVIKKHVLHIIDDKKKKLFDDDNSKSEKDKDVTSLLNFKDWCATKGVAFHNTMVDRITSQRDGSNGMVPKAEPVPLKALVIEDLNNDLPSEFTEQTDMKTKFGVVIRNPKLFGPQTLDNDIVLKLRVANGTHTAIAHTLALSKLLQTDVLSKSQYNVLMNYLDSLFTKQILEGASDDYGYDDTRHVYDDWRTRLTHPYFGLSSFFITQNGAAKGGIRLTPTVVSLMKKEKPITVAMAYAYAALLRFLTPVMKTDKVKSDKSQNPSSIYFGWLDGHGRKDVAAATISDKMKDDNDNVVYADGMRHNCKEGWYEFKCSCEVNVPVMENHKEGGASFSSSSSSSSTTTTTVTMKLVDALGFFEQPQQPKAYENIIRAYLLSKEGGNFSSYMNDATQGAIIKEQLNVLVSAISVLYARMVAGDTCMDLLMEISSSNNSKDYVKSFGFDTPISNISN